MNKADIQEEHWYMGEDGCVKRVDGIYEREDATVIDCTEETIGERGTTSRVSLDGFAAWAQKEVVPEWRHVVPVPKDTWPTAGIVPKGTVLDEMDDE